MDRITLYRYALPCCTGVVLRKQPLTVREGLVIQLEQAGKIGLGEIAPLPSFSQETLAEATEAVVAWSHSPHLALETLPPSVAFGISCALAELNGTLHQAANTQSAILCDGDFAAFAAKIAHQRTPLGKIKIGFDAQAEGKFAAQLLQQFPQLQLRLDANRAWQLPQAVEFAEQIAKPLRSRIQFIEEPCQTPAQSSQFAQQTGIAIAWDETVREPNFLVKPTENLTAIVLKPTLIGSLEKCIALIEQAHAQGIRAVISSSIESSLGLSQLARIAHQYTPEMAAGLDTLHLMQSQLIRPFNGSNLPLANLESPFIEKIMTL